MTAVIPGRAPATDAEWARSVEDRLRGLQSARTVRVGPWVLSNDAATGALRATRPGQTVLLDAKGATEEITAQTLDLSGLVSQEQLAEAVNGGGITDRIDSAFADLYELLTGNGISPVDALVKLGDFFKAELGGMISPSRLPILPMSHIRDTATELLDDPEFDVGWANTSSEWMFDETDGVDTPGCAKVNADGLTHTLYSNVLGVTEEDELAVMSVAKWEGLTTAAATPVQTLVSFYNAADVLIGGQPVLVAQIGDSGDSGGWITVNASLTPPSGAVSAYLELTVTTGATGGVVKFGKASVVKTGGLSVRLSKINPEGLLDAATGLVGEIANEHVPGLHEIADYIHSAMINPGTQATGLSEIRDNLQKLNDSIRQGAEGVPSTGAIADDLLNALKGLREAQSSTATRLSQIETRLPGATGGSAVVGNTYLDDVERPAAQGWGPDWLTLGPAAPYGVSSDGHQWNWTDYSNVQRVQPGIYLPGQTDTDYQIVRDTMATLMESPQAWTADGPNSANGLIARSNVGGTEWVLALRFYNAVALYRYVNGVYTQIGDAYAWTPRAGARWELRAGDPVTLDPNRYTLLMNDQVAGVWDDSQGLVAVDADHRYGGEYMQSDDRNTGESTPGSISTWSITDNPPPGPMVGSGGRVARTAFAAYAIAAQTGPYPPNHYDTTEGSNTGVSSDMEFDPATNRYTAKRAAQYLFKIGQKHAELNGNLFQLLILKNGQIWERGSQRKDGTNTTESFVVWLNVDEYVEPGYYSSFSGNYLYGSVDGTETYFTATLVNQGAM